MHSDPKQMAELSAAQDLIRRGVPPFLMEMGIAQIYTFDAQSLRLVSANRSARTALGCDMRDLRRAKFWEIFPGLDQKRVRRIAAALKRRGRLMPVWITGPYDDAAQYYSVVTMLHDDDRKSSIVVVLRDVTRFVAARTEALEARNLLNTAIETLPDAFAYYDADDRLVLFNEMYREFYADSAEAIVPGALFEDILRFGLERGQYKDAIGCEEAWITDRIAWHRKGNLEIEQLLSSGRWIRVVERTTPEGGKVGMRVDITPQKVQQAELERLLLTDDLTGLRNRRNLDQEVGTLAERLCPDQRVVIFHIDLEQFKPINDVYGHEAGDHVLQCAGRALTEVSVPPDIVARVGGDEFVVVLIHDGTDAEIRRIGRELKAKLAHPIRYKDHLCYIGGSVGVSFLCPGEASRAAAAMTAADIAMNRARRQRTADVVIFEEAMREQTTRSTLLVSEMKDAIERNEFRPYFQPQINLKSGKTIGFEALIRWERSVGPAVPAGEFLTVAQNAGLTPDLDRIVLDGSCLAVRQLKAWGFQDPCVSINMSMLQINDANLLDQLDAHVTAHQISRSNLRIELLESTLLDDRAATTIENVHRLIGAGYKVELDDFGTGHAAIATLRKFAVSRIKIDRSLVSHIDQDQELQTITSAIINMAQGLKISVLAEGVETAEEQEMLLKFHCDIAQGYYHAKPMAMEDLKAFLINKGDLSAELA